MFIKGQTYHRQSDLHDTFGGNRQSGISPCANHPYIFLFTTPRGEEYGYRDGWQADGTYAYTGEGQAGKMELIRGNLAIKNHAERGRELHLFEKVSGGLYEYLGQFEYLTHTIREGTDKYDRKRDMIVFTLGLVKGCAADS